MPTRASWTNPDGLVQYFGKRYTENNIAASNPPALGERTVEMYIRGEDIPASVSDGASLPADPRSVTIPAGSVIVSAILYVDELFAGSSSTLDAGTSALSTGLAVDMNGLIAAQALAGLTAGARIAGAGALINTKLASNQQVVFGYGTAAFTNGSARLVVKYIEPPVQTS